MSARITLSIDEIQEIRGALHSREGDFDYLTDDERLAVENRIERILAKLHKAEKAARETAHLLAKEMALNDGWTWEKCEPGIQQTYRESAETILEGLAIAGLYLSRSQPVDTPHEGKGADTNAT